MQRSSRRLKLVFALFCLLTPFPLLAQSDWGNITGVVTDPSGSVIAGAEVTIVAIATNTAKTTKLNVRVPAGEESWSHLGRILAERIAKENGQAGGSHRSAETQGGVGMKS